MWVAGDGLRAPPGLTMPTPAEAISLDLASGGSLGLVPSHPGHVKGLDEGRFADRTDFCDTLLREETMQSWLVELHRTVNQGPRSGLVPILLT
jgi:hypothetical protein